MVLEMILKCSAAASSGARLNDRTAATNTGLISTAVLNGNPQATAFPGIHRIPVRTPMDQPAVGARLADKRRIDSGADPDQDTGLILTPVLSITTLLALNARLHEA